MPDLSWVAIAGGAWALLLVFVWALCAAAGRADGRQVIRSAARPRPRTTPPVVADTGGIRAHLRAAAGLIEAEQLTVTVDIDGTDAVIASSRSVVAAQAGDWPQLTAPVRLGGREIATLRAIRRPGAPPFDSADRLMVQALAARVSGSMQTARSPASAPAGTTDAMAET